MIAHTNDRFCAPDNLGHARRPATRNDQDMTVSHPELVTPVAVSEVPAWLRAAAVTFLENPGGSEAQVWIEATQSNWDPERAWGVRDRDRWVATLRTEPRSVTVPGADGETRELAADALTAVTVAATHRRQGWMSRMLDRSLAAARARGDAVSILIAAQWAIYGRFGYAPATLGARYVLHRERRGASVSGDLSRVRQVELDELRAVAPAVFAAARRERAGQVDRSATWWELTLGTDRRQPLRGLPHNVLLHDGDDGPDGLLGWKATAEPSLSAPDGRVEVWELATAGRSAYVDLWAYLTGLDGVSRITLPRRPVDEPIRWRLGDGRALERDQQLDFLWLRLLDVPAALAARRYAIAGELVLEVTDPTTPVSVAGRYALHAEDDTVQCEPTRRPVDIALDQRALAAAYLGGFAFGELAHVGLVQEHRAGALRRANLMFSTAPAPWNATGF